MIKFFRKIRHSLLLEGKTGKYLKYAIGEIVLVMIGILLAVQVNNWNEERKSNDLLRKYEKNIIVELNADLSRIAELDSIHENWKKSLIDYLHFYNAEKPDLNILKSKRDSSKTGITPLFNTVTYSIQDIISTGNLKLFTVDKKNAILKYKDLTERNRSSENESGNFILGAYAELEKEIDLLTAYNYSEKEHRAVENWQYDLNSHQMRLWNNVVAKFLNFYEYQLLLHEQVRVEANELIKIMEKPPKDL